MLFTIGFLSSVTIAVIIAGWVIGGGLGAGFGFLISVIMIFVSWFFIEHVMKRIFDAHPFIDDEIDGMVKRLSAEARIKEPLLYMIESQVPNSFAVGRNKNHSSIFVTRGILDFSNDEIEGVIAHQISHIARQDMIVWGAVAVFASFISFPSDKIYSLCKDSDNDCGVARRIILYIFTILFALPAAALVRAIVTTKTEHRADRSAGFLTKKPLALASAIRKMDAIAQKEKINGPFATAHLWIVNPFRDNHFYPKLFEVHPLLINRMHMLEQMANRGDKERVIMRLEDWLY
ncbi:MAG: M48 family metalloprotease [Candidatus Micrarchaeota archaeon]|nr:M48 family metalloprotease [Candidatus Micrarchaeota archaeon]